MRPADRSWHIVGQEIEAGIGKLNNACENHFLRETVDIFIN